MLDLRKLLHREIANSGILIYRGRLSHLAGLRFKATLAASGGLVPRRFANQRYLLCRLYQNSSL